MPALLQKTSTLPKTKALTFVLPHNAAFSGQAAVYFGVAEWALSRIASQPAGLVLDSMSPRRRSAFSSSLAGFGFCFWQRTIVGCLLLPSTGGSGAGMMQRPFENDACPTGIKFPTIYIP
jgi:hypothetical protein